MVNDCEFPRRCDFKRLFEDLITMRRRKAAAFGLTGVDTMRITAALNAKTDTRRTDADQVRTMTSLILVSKRTAGGG